MWISFSLSEIRELKKSDIHNGCVTISEAVVTVNRVAVAKKQAKAFTRIRKHQIHEYIHGLIKKTNPNID